MTFVSKLALAAVLTLGSPVLVSTPALAQKAPQLKVSKEFQTAGAAAEAAIKAENLPAAETAIVNAESVAKNDDEKYYAASLRLQLELRRKNEAAQVKALDTLIASPKTPPEQLATYKHVRAYLAGAILLQQQKPAEAIPLLLQARQLGSTQTDIPVLLANAYAATNKQAEALAEVTKAIDAEKAAGKKPTEEFYKFAISRASATNDRAVLLDWLRRYLADYSRGENWRWAILNYRQKAPAGTDQKTERLQLYRLMRATNALADQQDYADYSYSAQASGLPWEAVSVIDEGRKSGKLPTSEAGSAKTYTTAQAAAKAEGSLDTLAKQAGTAANGRTAKQTGDAFLASGNHARAVELYDVALQKGGVDADEVNLNRGMALRALGRRDEAKTAFGQVKSPQYLGLAQLWQTSIDFPPAA